MHLEQKSKRSRSKIPNILLLFCGGTIVMEKNEEGTLVVPPREKAMKTLLTLEPRLSEVAKLSVEYIDNLDSTNMTPSHWDTIADTIAKNYEAYDGFVITHGTNTMAYTSSALSYALGDLGKPVVLTGAQIPGGKIETDARRNFVNAVQVAALDCAGVFIVFDEEIIYGSRATKVSESKLDAFETVNWDLAGEIRIDMRLSDECPRRHSRPLSVKTGFEESVAIIHLVPGTPVSLLDGLLDNGVRGFILRGFGPGDIAYNHLPFLKRAQKMRTPVVVHSQCQQGATCMHINDVGKKALDLGVIQAYDMSIESTATKLMWLLKRGHYEGIAALIQTNMAGEINVDGKIY